MTKREPTRNLAACAVASLRFPYGFPDDPVSLANHKNSLGRYSQRTHGHCSTALRPLRRFHARTACNQLISCSLHLPQGVLCSFRSRYYYTIGLEECLGLEASASHIHAQFPMRTTLDTQQSPVLLPLRDCHPLWCFIPEDFEFNTEGVRWVQTPHLYTISVQIRFALFRVRSPLLTESRLISFPLPTKMLQFGRLPFANANVLRDRKSHSVISGSMAPCAFPE